MFKDKWNAVKQELLSYSPMERLFILSAMVCGFLITTDYSIIRPVANSVFIHAFGSQFFPYVWLAAIPFNLLVVSLYNRFLPKLGCMRMFLTIILTIALGNLFCGLFLKKIAWLPFFFYLWKEVYIVLLFQQLWSVVHSTIKMSRAKYLYGLLFAVGGAGGVVGSMIPGFFAVQLGSESLLFFALPVYVLLTIAYHFLLKNSAAIQGGEEKRSFEQATKPALLHSLQMIVESRFLTFILLIVVFMQVTSTIVDYQFNRVLEEIIGDKDQRTEYAGRILGMVNLATISLQLFGSFLLVHLLGLKRSHFFVPVVLCINALGFMAFPLFGVITYSYVSIKSIDFSIFGVIKEMLYIPMKVDEKFRAKAIIDVFAYRTAKAFGSFLILAFQFSGSGNLISLLSISNIAIFLSWCLLVAFKFKNDQLAPQNSL